ncbi:POP1 ribonuclease P/MRP subunit [Anticarsia gemmatalis]|uniref:POP1 ribonuclease P/MRP subunit n=1 Tax=Anticarsia gemmatalis TaxID=129554 RepID=UPI003F75FA91
MGDTEFDATLGGSEHLPFSANSLKFAASRSVEIAAMTESILRPSKTKLVFQSLPVHMRRRVMSHNCKRLPRNLRLAHLEQLKKSGLPPKQKRPSRKYRRRPANLLEEYTRRQKRNVWLETHIWHAKRFHMTERWGYRLPYAPCDKAFRACYRGSSAHCLLQDISYHTPIQIIGAVELIRDMFSNITNSSCGLGVCAKAYINGTRQGTVHLYGINTFPFGYIAQVQFIWVPSDGTSKTLWLFVHPSQTKQVESLLCDLKSGSVSDDDYQSAKKRKKVNSYDGIQVKVMPGAFNRFCLTGPNSHAILVQSLKCITENDASNHKWMSLHTPQDLGEKAKYWQTISTLNSPSQLPSNMVIGLVVIDPRLRRPRNRTKAKQDAYPEVQCESLVKVPEFLSTSPLWDVKIHETIKKEKKTTGQFIEHVTDGQLVPGEINEDDPFLQSVPVVLIQRPGSQNPELKKLGYGSGWDIIMPSGYALPFWLTFIMFGARSGALRETESLSFEMGECFLPPDSNAGNEHEKRIESELRDRYFRLPPSKRVNYIKLAISTPFRCPWQTLLNDWSEDKVNDFFVLRDRTLLSNIQERIMTKRILPNMANSSSCLVPVYLKLVGRGCLKHHAVICLPESHDINTIKSLFEPHHEDSNEKIRKQKRLDHVKLAKKLKRNRMKLKMKSKLVPRKSQKVHKNEPSEYVKSMRELWLPSTIDTVRNVPSRQVMGYIAQGAFSFTEARSCGVGYIAYNAINMLLSRNFNQVLVRNTTSKKYYLANIVIINNK